MKTSALLCHESTDSDALACRGALPGAPLIAGDEIMFMPAGLHWITPSQNGKAVRVQVLVDRESARAIEAQRAGLVASGRKPFFDFNHEDGAASFRPSEFFWKDGEHAGVYARGEWTPSGLQARDGKEFSEFSPVFHVDNVNNRPARIINGLEHGRRVEPNMGGLVNDPAFKTILPLWAKDAGENGETTQPNRNMNEKEIAELRARNQELETELNTLKAKDQADALVKEQRARIEAEIAANNAKLDAEALRARNEQLETAEKDRRKAAAEVTVSQMIERGAIAAKDEKTIEEVKKNLIADPATFEPIYARWAGNPAVTNPRVTNGSVTVTSESPNAKIKAYAALVAENAKLPLTAETAKQKGKLALKAHAIFAKDLEADKEIESMPMEEAVKAADNSDVNVGLLSGTLVLNRVLSRLQYEFPILSAISTDYSDTPGLLGQTEVSQIIVKPAVQTYDGTPDSGGRPQGWKTASPAQAVNVPVSLDTHVGVPIVFGVQTLASTTRNLFEEQVPMALYALGEYAVGKLTALMTAANFNAYAGTTVGSGETTDGSESITVASTANMYPGQAISGTGIPSNTYVASITSGTTAKLTQAATATNSGLTFTLGASKVPTTYSTYAKALADFCAADLGKIGAAFSTNEVPLSSRFVLLNSLYHAQLAEDPSLNGYFAAVRKPEIVTEGALPPVRRFQPIEAPWMPSSSNRVGFAGQKSSLILKSRLPNDFTNAVNGGVPGSVTTVTVPGGLSVLLVQYVDLRGNYAEYRPEVLLGAAVGERRCGLVLTSA